MVNNNSLRNETTYFLREVCIECVATSHNCNKINLKVKELVIVAQKSSMEHGNEDMGWSEDDSNDKEVDNEPAGEVENKLRMLLEKKFKRCFKR